MSKNPREIRYAIMHNALDCDYGIALSARTDLGARRQARKIAREHGLTGYAIVYYRYADGGRGTIDA